MALKRLTITLYGLTASTLAFCASEGAYAQAVNETPVARQDSGETSEGDIVVTAQRRSQSINNVGMAVSAMSGDQLRNQGLTDIKDLTRVVPGFTFAESQKGAPVYTLRGVGYYEESLAATPAVSIYLDEVGYAFPVMAKAATLDLERVEVLKGPQGTLYGQNSTGGAINYIAAKPSSTFKAGGEIGYGRYDAFSATAYVSGPLTDTLSARLSGGIDKGGAWQHSYTRDARNGDRDLLRGRLLLRFEPSSGIDFTLNANGYRDRSDTVAAALLKVTPQSPARVTPQVAGQILAPEEPGVADWNPGLDLQNREDYYQFSLKGNVKLADAVTLHSITAYQHYQVDSVRDTDGSAVDEFRVNQRGKIKSFFQELRLDGEALDNRLNWLLGASYAHDSVLENNVTSLALSTSANAFVRLGFQPFDGTGQFSDSTITTKAVFGNGEFKFTDQLSLSAGVRYTNSRTRYSGCMLDVDGNYAAGITIIARSKGAKNVVPKGACVTLDVGTAEAGLVNDVLKEDNVSWRVGLNFKPTTHSLIYGTVSRGYKAGTFPNLNATSSIALTPVRQERVLAFEAGTKVDLGRFVHVDASVFYYIYDDKQLRGRIIDPLGAFGASEALVNIPKSKVTGAELAMTVRPVEGVSLRAGGIYLDTKVTKDFFNYDPFGVRVNYNGEPYPFSPKWQLSGAADYDTAVYGSLHGFVGADVTYQSHSTSAFGNSPLMTIDSYALVSARVGIANPDNNWRLTVWGKNLFNVYYWTDTFRQIDNLARHVAPPRTFGVKFSYDF